MVQCTAVGGGGGNVGFPTTPPFKVYSNDGEKYNCLKKLLSALFRGIQIHASPFGLLQVLNGKTNKNQLVLKIILVQS